MEDLVLSCLESRVEANRNLYARFLVGPFLRGDALTAATALRRVLLSSVESIGITALYIQGITHEFSTIVGVRESVLELSLNFGAIVLSYDKTFYQKKSFFDKLQIGYLQVQGPKVVYANHLKLPLGVKLVDPTQYITTISKEGFIALKFVIGKRNIFFHPNIGSGAHFGDQAKNLLMPEEICKKNIALAKKTCFYRNGSTINSFLEPVASLTNRRFVRSSKQQILTSTNLGVSGKAPYKSSYKSLICTCKSFAHHKSYTNLRFVRQSLYKASLCKPLRAKICNACTYKSKICMRSFVNSSKIFDFKGQRFEITAKPQKSPTSVYKASLCKPLRTKICKKICTGLLWNSYGAPTGLLWGSYGAPMGLRLKTQYPKLKTQNPKPKTQNPLHSSLSICYAKDMQNLLQVWGVAPRGKNKKNIPKKPFESKRILDTKKNRIKQKKVTFLSNSDIFKSNICLRNVIPLDLHLTPVLKVNFVVEIDDEVLYLHQKLRERIILEVWTNGSIDPRQAVHDSALRLLDMFASFRSIYQVKST